MKRLLALSRTDRSMLIGYAESRLESVHVQMEMAEDSATSCVLQGRARELRWLIDELTDENDLAAQQGRLTTPPQQP